MNFYEHTLVARQNLSQKDIDTIEKKYEDLINDTKSSLLKIINFLQKFMNIKIEDKKILKTIESCNFENLRKMEKDQGFDEAAYSEKLKKKIDFFHLGKNNNWKNLIHPDLEKKIRTIFNNEMKELNYI